LTRLEFGFSYTLSFQTMVNNLMTLAFMTRSLNTALPMLTPAQTEALIKDWFALWWKAANQPGGPVPDEATFRELLLKPLQHAKDAGAPKK
jgi:hypothetical protein